MSKVNANDLVVAVLHRVGRDPHLRDDVTMARLFNQASQEFPTIFGNFAWHPQYKDSKLLSRSLANLDIGGDIYHEAASGINFRLSERVISNYGAKVYDTLPAKARKAVDRLASNIKEAYTA